MPTGTVTFLFTDLESSTRLWEAFPDAMQDALARHDALVRAAVAAHDGYLVKTTGDGAHAAFATAPAAIDAAIDAQLALARESWGETGPLLVRMGLHTGVSELRESDYYGTAVNRAARIASVAHGGQVVCSQATADLARDELSGSKDLRDLGEHRLRDLRSRERVFQVTHVELRAEFPPLRSIDAFPGNLPLQLSGFTGRGEELAQVSEMLAHERLVTITGSGGVGKTRLALEVAAAVLPHFPDGAWFVDLAPVGDPDFVAAEIATTIGLLENRQGSPAEALVRALATRHTLVVLDNCEHLVDVVARIVDLIVRRCPNVTVLATSQETLGVDGETTYALRPLLSDDATRLFVERAAAARRGFELTAENGATIVELCRRLDGIPLAIELAAARVASMSPAAILERIDERFRLLAQGRRTAQGRHQTLRAAVEWSYGLLEPEEQIVFTRLSVFAGDFTLEAAEAVASDDTIDALDVVDVLSGLVAKSMVVLEDSDDVDHYRLLETMRAFGRDHTDTVDGDLARLQARHAAYYLGLAELAAPHLVGSDDEEWLGRIEAEYPNVRAALTFTRDQGDPAEHARFTIALALYWRTVSSHREGLGWLKPALAIEPAPPGRERAEAFAVAGLLSVNLDRYDEGFALIQQSLQCSARAGELPRPLALIVLALAALVQNRPEDVRRYGAEAVDVARRSGDPYDLGEALAHVGMQMALTSDDPRGVELADESLDIARTLDNGYLLSLALESAGIARYRIDPAGAVELLQRSLIVGLGNRNLQSMARFIKAVAHVSLREHGAAARDLCVVLPIMQEGGEVYFQSMALALTASILMRSTPDVAVRILALLDRLREEKKIVGAPRDLEMQARLRQRAEERIEPPQFAANWSAGRTATLDDTLAIALDQLAVIAEGG